MPNRYASTYVLFALLATVFFIISPTASFAQRGALSLDGEGFARADNDEALSIGTNTLAVEAWIRHDGTSDEDAVIVTKRDGNVIDYELTLVGSGEEVPVRFYVFSTSYTAESSVGIRADRWTHVAGVYADGIMAIYVDGQLSGTRSLTLDSRANTGPLYVGTEAETGRFFSGQIDEVRIWNVGRSGFDVRETLYSRLPEGTSGLVAYYDFDGDEPLQDGVGANHLALTGDASVASPGIFPVAPDLVASSGNASVMLNWSERLGPEDSNLATEFNIYRSSQSDASDRQLVTTIAGDETTYTDSGLTNGSIYYYVITATNGESDESDFSAVATARPFESDGGGALLLENPGYARGATRPTFDMGGRSFAVEAWVRHDGTSQEDAVIVTKRQGNVIDYELTLVGAGEETLARFYIFSTSYYAETSVGIPARQWTHVAGVYGDDVMRIYVNGELSGTRSLSLDSRVNEGALFVGSEDGADRFFSGMIDEVRIWRTSLTAQEVRQSYRLERLGLEEDLSVYFRFDDVGGAATSSIPAGGTLQLVGNADLTAGGVFPIAPRIYARPGHESAFVAWADGNPEAASQFTLYRSTQPDGGNRQPIATLPAGSLSFNDATLSNGTTYYYEVTAANDAGQASSYSHVTSVTPSESRDGNALVLGGAGDYARMNSIPSLDMGSQSLTVEAWIKHDGTSDEHAVVVSKREGNVIDYELTLWGEGQEVLVRFYVFSTSYFAESDVTIPADDWTHVAGAYRDGMIFVYVDGALAGSRSLTLDSRDNDGPLYIGAEAATGRFFSGMIDEVRIWRMGRTLAEIEAHRYDILLGNEEHLEAYFRFDETSGTTSLSSVSPPQTMTLFGNATFSVSESPVYVQVDESLPAVFTLDGNYPNPFNPRTVIRYGLSEPDNVRLVVYDLTGRRIAVLEDGTMRPAGWHEVPFDAAGLASGVYLYRVESGASSAIGRMILMK